MKFKWHIRVVKHWAVCGRSPREVFLIDARDIEKYNHEDICKECLQRRGST